MDKVGSTEKMPFFDLSKTGHICETEGLYVSVGDQ